MRIDRQTEIKRLRAVEAELKPRCASAEKQVKHLLAQVPFTTPHRFPKKHPSFNLATRGSVHALIPFLSGSEHAMAYEKSL